MCKFGLHRWWEGDLEFQILRVWKELSFVIAGEGGGGNLWKPPVRTKRRRRKGVVFPLSIVGLATELRRSGDAIIQEACGSLFLRKVEAAFQHKTEAKFSDSRLSKQLSHVKYDAPVRRF